MKRCGIGILIATLAICSMSAARPTGYAIDRVELLSNPIEATQKRDWQAGVRDFDALVFDANSGGEFLPLRWIDRTNPNAPAPMLGLPSYLRTPDPDRSSDHEAVATLSVLLGSRFAGVDHARGEIDFIAGASGYFNSKNGQNVVLNRTSTTSGQSWWYELFPQILFNSVADRYPDEAALHDLVLKSADRWHHALATMPSRDGVIDFNFTAFNLLAGKPVDNGKWREPDAAAGLAWIFLNAYATTHDERYLADAQRCLTALQANRSSPLYEVLLPFGVYAAARMNAEHDTHYDVACLLDWSFGPSGVRPGWGMIVDDWGGRQTGGLIGSITDGGGYAFGMNTYAYAMALLPAVRYDDRLARPIGKWLLNAEHAAQYFYPDALPSDHQSLPDAAKTPLRAIPYEGLRRTWNGRRPVAMGDPTVHGWGPCDLSIYAGGLMGVFAAQVQRTDDPQILRLDVNATDIAAKPAYPTYLLYNPYPQERTISIDVGGAPVDLYDTVSNQLIAENVRGKTTITLPADDARVLVYLPAGSDCQRDGERTRVGDRVIDYTFVPAPTTRPSNAKPIDRSAVVRVPRQTIRVDGDLSDWPAATQGIDLDTAGRGTLRARVRFAWDADNLYVAIEERVSPAEPADWTWPANALTPIGDAVALYVDPSNGSAPISQRCLVDLALSARDGTLAFSAMNDEDDPKALRAATRGDTPRRVEAAIAWSWLQKATVGSAAIHPPRAGDRLAVDPLLIEHDHTRQSFRGGSHYDLPSADGPDSTDLLLEGPPR